ncbi:MAG: 50S ribosomal protein L4 [Tenericutes bacterium]|nr:50S ribosomal protein L4 [Mycoplasmatota bacterium]
MAKVDIINLNGEKVKDIKLNDAIYNIESNEVVVKKALDLQLASLRQGTHKTKTRAEVSGGGRKPYKQKGTGNARQGSTRAPHYRHGGVAFGVTPRDYTFKMNKKERVLALRSVLSMKAKENNIKVIDSLTIESLKTKDLKNMLSNLGLNGKTLFITSNDAENLYLASRNLNNVGVLLTSELNVYDMLHADTIVLDEEAVKQIEEVLK